MANLRVRIVVRHKKDGKRSWIVANGKTDPPGTYYLRQSVGSQPKYTRAGDRFDEAETAKIRLERKLKAESQGFIVPEEISADAKKFHRITDVITTYLSDLRLNRRPAKSIKGKKSELEEFAKFCGKVYVEQINRTDLITYRNHLLDAGSSRNLMRPQALLDICFCGVAAGTGGWGSWCGWSRCCCGLLRFNGNFGFWDCRCGLGSFGWCSYGVRIGLVLGLWHWIQTHSLAFQFAP